MPVDAKPITVMTSTGKTIKAFVPHWGNCPGAETFRKTTDGAAPSLEVSDEHEVRRISGE